LKFDRWIERIIAVVVWCCALIGALGGVFSGAGLESSNSSIAARVCYALLLGVVGAIGDYLVGWLLAFVIIVLCTVVVVLTVLFLVAIGVIGALGGGVGCCTLLLLLALLLRR
jgi:hypothetical protein